MLTYQLKTFNALTDDIAQIIVVPLAEPLIYRAGQYLTLTYPDNSQQPFSIANTPNKNSEIELHIRHLATDAATTAMLKQLQATKKVSVYGPFGNAFYRHSPDNPVILLAGGTGFAYIKAIVEQAMFANDLRTLHLYWGVKTAKDFYLPELPELWRKKLKNFYYTKTISRAEKNSSLAKIGYAYHAVVEDYVDLSTFQVYASGPQKMIADAWQLFQAHGLPRKLMYSDML